MNWPSREYLTETQKVVDGCLGFLVESEHVSFRISSAGLSVWNGGERGSAAACPAMGREGGRDGRLARTRRHCGAFAKPGHVGKSDLPEGAGSAGCSRIHANNVRRTGGTFLQRAQGAAPRRPRTE